MYKKVGLISYCIEEIFTKQKENAVIYRFTEYMK